MNPELIEFTNTRHNHMIEPHFHVWGWELPAYLFLGGLVAGLMILSGYHMLRDQWDKKGTQGHFLTTPLLSMGLISAGMLCLLLDLEHPLYVWRLFLTFEPTAPMSWGSWILMLVYPILMVSTVVGLRQSMPDITQFITKYVPGLNAVIDWLRQPKFMSALGWANMGVGISVGIYTGILLSALSARPLWNSALLGPLFLLSGLSAGAALMHILTEITGKEGKEAQKQRPCLKLISMCVIWLRPKNGEDHKLTNLDNVVLLMELGVISMFFIGLISSSQVAQDAAMLLLSGAYAAAFWCFVVILGILVPLFLQFLQSKHRIQQNLIPAILVLGGGLALRFVILYAGQASHW